MRCRRVESSKRAVYVRQTCDQKCYAGAFVPKATELFGRTFGPANAHISGRGVLIPIQLVFTNCSIEVLIRASRANKYGAPNAGLMKRLKQACVHHQVACHLVPWPMFGLLRAASVGRC